MPKAVRQQINGTNKCSKSAIRLYLQFINGVRVKAAQLRNRAARLTDPISTKSIGSIVLRMEGLNFKYR
jgi:hypothetical protein